MSRIVVHNYFPVGDEAEFKEGDHPRDPDGKFASGGGGGGGEGEGVQPSNLSGPETGNANARNVRAAPEAFENSLALRGVLPAYKASRHKFPPKEAIKRHVNACRAYLNQPQISTLIAYDTAHFLSKHTVGVGGQMLTHGVVLSSVHTAVAGAMGSLGYSEHGTAAVVATGVAGYAIHQLMEKTGLTPKNAHRLLWQLGRDLYKKYAGVKREGGKLERRVEREGRELERNLDAQSQEDTVKLALERLVKALSDSSTDELLKAGRQAQKPDAKDGVNGLRLMFLRPDSSRWAVKTVSIAPETIRREGWTKAKARALEQFQREEPNAQHVGVYPIYA